MFTPIGRKTDASIFGVRHQLFFYHKGHCEGLREREEQSASRFFVVYLILIRARKQDIFNWFKLLFMHCKNCGWDNPTGLEVCEKCKQPLPVSQSFDNESGFAGRKTMAFSQTYNMPKEQPSKSSSHTQQAPQHDAPRSQSFHWMTKTYLWLTIIFGFLVSAWIFASMLYWGYDSFVRNAQEHYGFREDDLLLSYINLYALGSALSAIFMLRKKTIGIKLQLYLTLSVSIYLIICNYMHIVYNRFEPDYINIIFIVVLFLPTLLLYTLTSRNGQGLQALNINTTDQYINILHVLELCIPIVWILSLTANTLYFSTYYSSSQFIENLGCYFLTFAMIFGATLLFMQKIKVGHIIYYVAAVLQGILITFMHI